MRRRLRWLTCLAGLLGAVGCQHKTSMTQPKAQPPDPLLISKKPVDGRPNGAYATVAREPSAPRETVVQQEQTISRPIRMSFRPPDDTGVTIDRPRTLP